MSRTPLVRHGVDERLAPHPETRATQHTYLAVHVEMMLQVSLDYASLPDVRALSASEIRFFYDGIRGVLKKHTKPKG